MFLTKSYMQALCFCESGLTLVGSQKYLAFEQQGASDVKEIYSPSTGLLRMRQGQSAGLSEGRIHVQGDLIEGSTFQELINTGQSRVSLAYDLCTVARWSNTPFMEGAMANRVFNLQSVQRQVKKARAIQAAILSDRLGTTRFCCR